MPIPLEISFHQMPRSVAIESRIREKAEKLARFCDRIIGCEVVVEAPAGAGRGGDLRGGRDRLGDGVKIIRSNAPSQVAF